MGALSVGPLPLAMQGVGVGSGSWLLVWTPSLSSLSEQQAQATIAFWAHLHCLDKAGGSQHLSFQQASKPVPLRAPPKAVSLLNHTDLLHQNRVNSVSLTESDLGPHEPDPRPALTPSYHLRAVNKVDPKPGKRLAGLCNVMIPQHSLRD